MPTPAKTHLPVKKFIAESNILDEDSSRDNEVCTSIDRLDKAVYRRADGSRRTWRYYAFLLPDFEEHLRKPTTS
jgi:hypothetical protein